MTKSQGLTLGVAGVFIILALWWMLAEALSRKVPVIAGYNTELPSSLTADSVQNTVLRDSILRADSIKFANATEFKKIYPVVPLPTEVAMSYGQLIQEDKLWENALRSIWLNLKGYFWAVLVCIPIGFLIGLFPLFRGLFSKPVDALRYLPLTALIGVFIIWFGIYDAMKVAFLAFGIIVFLLPTVISRIDDVEDVYLSTVFTLGASNWQVIKTVYFPAVMSRLLDDIRVLTAVSWTYIIVAEYINKDGGGLGALLYIKRRLQQVPDMFAIIMVIILIGFLQDRIFVYMGKRLFPHRHYKTLLNGNSEVRYGIYLLLVIFAIAVIFSNMPMVGTVALIGALAALVFIVFGEIKLQAALGKQS